ncbi:putative NADH:flavin oxidoreductase / NADH oxidase family protein [Lyophyllum shimeji]|uniref:NADH:flavin oxidoreductase / NADH oxidase family protein n=1 Tax=Lyophyllum shimeji TaxID=47721 RepID=A0A9P3URF8_LYOSH|nr:putative NADH:flavin oxidoreductase / NADH oxidase family protein [Lyophyllum shimeji]
MADDAGEVGVFSPVTLSCGRVLQNRLVKVALYEHLADFHGGPPNTHHFSLYSKWAQYDWGMVLTGNVQVSKTHLSLGRDVVIPQELSDESLQPFKQWAESMRGSGESGTLKLIQLSHGGRQSVNFIGGRPLFQPPFSPGSIPVKAKRPGWFTDALHSFAFQTPVPMTLEDIDEVVEAFVRGARVASEAGFDGVQLHAAHGYLLAQFISPLSNNRTDDYSAHQNKALRLLHRIAVAIRKAVPQDFVLGIKINSADYASSDQPNSEERVLDHLRTIAAWGGIDFVEVSGGDYEKPDFVSVGSPRQALFARFSKAAMETLESVKSVTPSAPLPLILLTGGLRTPELLHTVLASRHAHLLGIGRSSVLCPDLPHILKQRELAGTLRSEPGWSSPFRREPDLSAWATIRKYLPFIPLLGAGVNVAWHNVAMRRLANTPSPIKGMEGVLNPEHALGPIGVLFWMWVWVDVTPARAASPAYLAAVDRGSTVGRCLRIMGNIGVTVPQDPGPNSSTMIMPLYLKTISPV